MILNKKLMNDNKQQSVILHSSACLTATWQKIVNLTRLYMI